MTKTMCASFRPESITVNLLANDEVIDSKKLNEDNNWSHVLVIYQQLMKTEMILSIRSKK